MWPCYNHRDSGILDSFKRPEVLTLNLIIPLRLSLLARERLDHLTRAEREEIRAFQHLRFPGDDDEIEVCLSGPVRMRGLRSWNLKRVSFAGAATDFYEKDPAVAAHHQLTPSTDDGDRLGDKHVSLAPPLGEVDRGHPRKKRRQYISSADWEAAARVDFDAPTFPNLTHGGHWDSRRGPSTSLSEGFSTKMTTFGKLLLKGKTDQRWTRPGSEPDETARLQPTPTLSSHSRNKTWAGGVPYIGEQKIPRRQGLTRSLSEKLLSEDAELEEREHVGALVKTRIGSLQKHVRAQRRAHRDSDDYLGVTGANPLTGLADVETPLLTDVETPFLTEVESPTLSDEEPTYAEVVKRGIGLVVPTVAHGQDRLSSETVIHSEPPRAPAVSPKDDCDDPFTTVTRRRRRHRSSFD